MGFIKDVGFFVLAMFGIPLLFAIVVLSLEKVFEKDKPQKPSAERVYYQQALTKNKGDLKIGFETKEYAMMDEENSAIEYFWYADSREEGIRQFDSLLVEIIKHHCDSIVSYNYHNRNSPRFVCSFECCSSNESIELTHSSDNYEYQGGLKVRDVLMIRYTF